MAVKLTLGPAWIVRESSEQLVSGPLQGEERATLRRSLAERLKADPRIEFESPATWRGWSVVLRFGRVAGRLECTGIELLGDPDAAEQPALTSLALRELPLGRLIEEAREEYRQGLRTSSAIEPGTDSWDPNVSAEEREELLALMRTDVEERLRLAGENAGTRRRGRPPAYGPEHFARVAEIYRDAWRDGENPTVAVAERMHVSRSAAAKWVARARGLGLLPETSRGRAHA